MSAMARLAEPAGLMLASRRNRVMTMPSQVSCGRDGTATLVFVKMI